MKIGNTKNEIINKFPLLWRLLL